MPALIALAATAVGAHTITTARRVDSVLPPLPALPIVTDVTEASARWEEIAGTYATGNQSGDRILLIHADGRIEYAELGTNGSVTTDADTAQLRRRGQRFSLFTSRTGVIDVLDLDTLGYWRDTYRRRR